MVHNLDSLFCLATRYLCVWGGQALADVDSKQGVLSEGDVKLEELGLAEVEQGSPKHSWRDFLSHSSPDLDVACVYTAVPPCPRTWSEGKRNCIICDYKHRLWESIVNHWNLLDIILCKNSWPLKSKGQAPLALQTVHTVYVKMSAVTVGCKMMPLYQSLQYFVCPCKNERGLKQEELLRSTHVETRSILQSGQSSNSGRVLGPRLEKC